MIQSVRLEGVVVRLPIIVECRVPSFGLEMAVFLCADDGA